ncbi:MAG: hypothetical protein ACREHC_08935 [Candidatus Levyibacteriota bacterium]
MEKRIVVIKRAAKDYLCKSCSRLVIVAKAKPWFIETNKSIIHTWDYGHQHRKLVEIVNDEVMQLENTDDQWYE